MINKTAPIFFQLCAAIAVSCWPESAAAKVALTAPRWNGEYLRPDQGIISLAVQGQGFSSGGGMGNEDEPAQIQVRQIATGARFLLLQNVTAKPKEQRSDYWKLPTGLYRIDAVTRMQGKTLRTWTAKKTPGFAVPSMALADLGIWTIRPQLTNYLQMKFSFNPVQAFAFPNGNEALGAITNGFTGKQLKKLKGGANSKTAANNFGSNNEMRATVKGERSITMTYRLDVKRSPKFNRRMFSALARREARFRQCFLDALDLNDGISGTAKFYFKLTNGSGVPDTLKHQGGTLRDQRTVDCLKSELGQTEFPVKTAVSGNLAFQFQVKY